MDKNFAEFLTTGGWNTPTHILERRLILSVVKLLCTRYTHSLHPHCTHKVENAKGKGCTCTRCTRGSGIPVPNYHRIRRHRMACFLAGLPNAKPVIYRFSVPPPFQHQNRNTISKHYLTCTSSHALYWRNWKIFEDKVWWASACSHW
jgi:hypothetical protein